MITEIKAQFDDLGIKAGKATDKFIVLPSAKGFIELAEIPFEEQEAEPIPFDECDYEYSDPKPANVDYETGEVYEEITDEARMIGDGNGND